jgi:hypothetical protein
VFRTRPRGLATQEEAFDRCDVGVVDGPALPDACHGLRRPSLEPATREEQWRGPSVGTDPSQACEPGDERAAGLHGEQLDSVDVHATLRRLLVSLEADLEMGAPSWSAAFSLARDCRLFLPTVDSVRLVEQLGTIQDLGVPWWRFVGYRCSDDAEERFLDAWERVRFLSGTFEDAVAHGLAHPAILPNRMGRPRALASFVATLAHLQEVGSPRPVLGSQEAFARAFYVEQATVSRWLARLQREGALLVATDYWHPRKPGAGSDERRQRGARTYWVVLERLAELAQEALTLATGPSSAAFDDEVTASAGGQP